MVLIGPGKAVTPDAPSPAEGVRVARVRPGRPRTTPDALLGDKAYSSRATRAALRARWITAVIAEPADQAGHGSRRGSKGGRPPAFDPVRYKGRNVVERSCQAIKQWRALATRYDKLAITYRAGLLIRAVLLWLQALGDTP